MDDELIYEIRDHAGFLIINREYRRNAINKEMISRFVGYLDKIDQDKDVHAVCITGAGEKAFCSGADLADTLGKEGEDLLSGPKQYAALLKRMAAFGKPLVARVNGPCLAGGIGLMLSCDIVIARNDAFFCTPEVNVGLFPMMIGALICRNICRKKAMEMVLTGRQMSAPEAASVGLITRAVDPERLDDEVQQTLQLVTSKSPIAMRLGKEAFHNMSNMLFEDAVDYLCEALGRVMSTRDAVEGRMAFLEKRKPRFEGK
jgi:enoyl-CoA hydratase/carnithine racemase